MIDLDTVVETRGGSRFDQVVALLIGLVAITATVLAVIQVQRSTEETRAHLMSSRLASDISTRIAATSEIGRLRLVSAQAAVIGGMEGLGRQLIAFETGDAVESARGVAEFDAFSRLIAIAERMGVAPAAGGPLDPYAWSVLAAPNAEIQVVADEQIRQADLAEVAGARGSMVVLGLSLIALAAVLAGLAAVLGDGRSGRVIVVVGYAAAGVAMATGVAALT